MNLKVISRNVGIALLVSALFMFLSIVVGLLSGRDSALAALSVSFTITFIIGIFPFIFVKKTPDISLKDGYMIVFLSWVISFIVGMLPYLLWGGPFTVVNAWFESVSGFTTTGATILENVEALPDSLLFWRSSTHFIGGLGVVVFLLLIIPQSSPVRLRLVNMGGSSLSTDEYKTRSNKVVFIFTYTYLGLNVLAFILYLLAGMSPFDAINHAMSVCATGGFSTRNLSIGAYNSILINLITMFFMLMSSIHFGIIYMVLLTRSLRPLNNPVLKLYLSTILLASLVVSFSLRTSGVVDNVGESLMDGFFQVMCYASTSGFAICDNSTWPLFPAMVLLLVGVQCGMAGSTSGGVKSDRMLLLQRAISRQVSVSIYPSKVPAIRYANKILKEEDVYPHVLYIAVFIFLYVVSVLLTLMISNYDLNAVYGSLACLSNVGPAIGPTIGSMGNYNPEPSAVKIIYTVDMLFGRLEIYPVFAVISMVMHRKR